MGLLKQVCLNNIEGIKNCLTTENANTKDSGGNTALHLAAEKGLLPVAQLLVEKGADVNVRNDCPGWTPLHFASYEGHLELVKFFVTEAGAIPNVKDNQGDTPETWALEWENYKCAMVISEATKKWKKAPPSASDSPKSSDEEEEDDEEMSHWVLPLPTVIPKDLSKPNINQLNETNNNTNKESADALAKEPDSKVNSKPTELLSDKTDNKSTLEPAISDDSTPKNNIDPTLPCNEEGDGKVTHDKRLSIVDQIKNSLSPDKAMKKEEQSNPSKEISTPSGPPPQPPVDLLPPNYNNNDLEPISENGAIVKTQTQTRMPMESPSLRKKNMSDSAPDIDKQLRYISKDKAFSRDLRGSAADIISMTNRFGDLARISRVKEDLLKKLDYLIEEERRQLENDLSKKLEELDRMKRRHREEEERVEFEISLLSEKLENLIIPPVFSSRGACFSPPSIEKDITCVGCSRICSPPAKIFQCEEGDILCQECKEDKKMAHCPECGIQILRGCSRNKALEKLARKHYDG